MKERFNTFISAIFAGICISTGAAIFLSLDNKIVGSFLFAIGLFLVLTFSLNLFTGKICYALDNKPSYIIDIILIWLGNLVGCLFMAAILGQTRIAGLSEKALNLCNVKLADSYISLFILGVFCNFFIYIAVEGFKNNSHEVGKYLGVIFGVMGFILCGTEHCVADMFYICFAGAWSADMFLRLIIITLGNVVGGIGFKTLHYYLKK